MTDKQVEEMCERLRVAFEVPTHADVVKIMVDRFLCWKLPKDFAPDAGISFTPRYNVGTPYERDHEPMGTNLLHAGQATEMVRHMLGLPNTK